MHVAICILTRRRPEGLARLLASLDAIVVPAGTTAEIVLVENDDTPRVEVPPTRLPLRRTLEPRLGIPFARNRALDEAAVASDLVAFLDDDETVDPDWLAASLRTFASSGADVVTGPALPRFPPGSPAWAERSRVYEAPRYPTGTPRPWAFTHNVIARSGLFRRDGGGFRFDPAMEFSGGSDKELFRRIADAGHRIAWADDAIAHEWYPAGRVNFRWILRRSFRLGTNAARAEGVHGVVGRLALLGRAARYAARGTLRGLANLLDPPVAVAVAGWDLARAAGLIAGTFGGRLDEYAERRDG
jgi:succinoglycan biosynthesis protein ExoM